MENFADFIFADHQFLFIFSDLGEIRKKKFRTNFFRKQFLPLRYFRSQEIVF